MKTVDKVRALFVPGEEIECIENTYFRSHGREEKALRKWVVGKVGKSVWTPEGDNQWRGTFPELASDVLNVTDTEATWRIRGDFSVTYRKVQA